MTTPPELVLASGSAARRQMLEAAGVAFRVMPAEVDEEAVRRDLAREGADHDPARVAGTLAIAKACEVSRRVPDALVIGGDQILEQGGEIFTKAAELSAARATLLRLAGRPHRLHSAVVLARGGAVLWSHVDTAGLTMRPLSRASIDSYLARMGERACWSVGAYEIEGLGIQLMERIDGDYFTILGMPLLPLLAQLRELGAASL